MLKRLAHVTLYVRDCEEALVFYTEKLGFEKRMDSRMDDGSRWLTVGLPGQEVEIVLHDPTHWHREEIAREMLAAVGKNPMWVWETDDFSTTYETLRGRGVKFVSEPVEVIYGMEAIFEDLYGNRFLLLSPVSL
ncbi:MULTISPECIES: VOC family protein [Brevibacillus]|uniref:VOC family protein n=1 Tax=Brevibacillus TaxID=55080 RepID=UPI000EE6763C|nr:MULTISPECIES: VOC family protein [Brevibacillus]TGV29791.1 lactoylglutathione lyase [Mesorhizobium sp. M00.F.Ca.ET.186.01.1.1]MDH6349756.1 catechol 2,3-dioxygenase-like lactoylglutathione lyase family enzyme [Brevibacillus sp. 1238]MDR4999211.1 VOC family protein [Brevibacillus parabrevis]MED1725925.1 VOC family protein [Brevibacillus parabrevis]MED2254232.1 VOC family protein [Brevibacillus parabrevis]